jgi:hypothetical protein
VHAALVLLDVDMTLRTPLAALLGLFAPLLELKIARLRGVRKRKREGEDASPDCRRSMDCDSLDS